MLSAFTARPIIELKQRDKSKIECILAHGDRVFVGLNTGSLRVYRVNEPSTPTNGTTTSSTTTTTTTDDTPKPAPQPNTTKPKPTDLLREVEKFSSRAIEQLAIIKEANIIVSLSNYAVSLHDWQTFEPIEAPLPRTKNASVFAVTSNIVKDSDTGIPEIISRLAVAVKRRLLLWSWHESELAPDVGEIVLSEAIRSVTWASATKVVCGMNGGYVLVDVVTRAVEDIVGPGAIGGPGNGQGSRFGAVSSAGMGYMGLGGYIPKPLAAKLADGEMLLAKDINSLFINDMGKALEKRQVPWAAAPEDIGYSYPYILALQPPSKGSLEVRNPDTLSLLQTIPLAGAAALHFPPPTSSLAHAGKGFHVLSDRVVWKMDATDYDSQVEELIQSGKYDEAISVLNMLEDALLKNKTETLREVKMRKAETLFCQKRYRDSMDLFNEDDVHAPPERVLKLFPRVISGELSGIPDKPEEDEPSSDHEGNGSTNGDNKPATADTPAQNPSSSPQKTSGFAKYLMGGVGGSHRKPANPETASIMSRDDTSDTASIKGGHKTLSTDDIRQQEEKDTAAAVAELFSYLAGTRVRLQRIINPETGRLRPRKSASGTTEEAFASLLSSHPDESDEQLEAEVQSTFRLIDTTLFRAYMYARPTLIGSLLRVPNFCDPEVVNEKLLQQNRYNELVDFFYGKKLHSQALALLKKFGEPEEPDPAAPGLHGPGNTVQYLLKLPAEMIDLILEYSEWTLRKDPELGMEVFLADSENAETLPRDRVVKFLAGIDGALEVRYLEHVIGELGDATPEFHNRLVEVLIKVLKERKESEGEEFDGLMERLVRFLRDTDEYGKLRAFNLIPRDGEFKLLVMSGSEVC